MIIVLVLTFWLVSITDIYIRNIFWSKEHWFNSQLAWLRLRWEHVHLTQVAGNPIWQAMFQSSQTGSYRML